MSEPLRDGRFVRLGPLGEGSQGATFDGIDKREGRAVAIKRFDVRGAKSWKDVELAEREARVLESLHHPKIPAYVDHFEHEGALYLVMEKVEGESLASLRKRGAVLGEVDVVRLLRDAAEVLDYLHGRAPAVIHRDLKPGNVVRRRDGSFAFVDFGAVRDKLRPQGGSTVVGTFGYMAPEQFQGRAAPASDVYAMGATALAMLTGHEPETLPHKGLAIDVRGALRGRVSDRLLEVLERMLDPDPDRRPSSIGPLLARMQSRPPETRAKGDRPRRKTARPRRAMPWPVALVLTLGLTGGMIAVGLALQVVLPVLLLLLSLFGIPGMRKASRAVRSAGARAHEAMTEARRRIQLGPARAEDDARIRVRVVDPTRARTAQDEADAAAAEEEAEPKTPNRERKPHKE